MTLEESITSSCTEEVVEQSPIPVAQSNKTKPKDVLTEVIEEDKK